MESIRTITVPNRFPPARRLPDAARAAAFALGALLLELVLARGLAQPETSRVVLLFLGVAALAFAFRFPLATALFFLALTDFVFHPTYFDFELGPLSVRPHELVLAALLAFSLLRPERRTWGGVAGGALAAFLAIVLLSAGLALADGRAGAADILTWGRSLFLLTFFYVVVRLFPAPEQRRQLLTGAAVLAAAAGVVALAVALGAGFGESLQSAGENAITSQEGLGSIERVRLVGLSAAYGLFWYAVVRATAAGPGRARIGWLLLLAGLAVNIAVSFNRNMWLGLGLGLVLMAVVGGNLVRSRLLAAVAALAVGVVLVTAFGGASASNSLIDPVVQRGTTLLQPDELSSERSFQDRQYETEIALDAAEDNLIFGVGIGAEFDVFVIEQIGPHSYQVSPQLYLHNQYIYLLLIGGVPGLIAFVLFLLVPVVKSMQRRPRDPAIAACGVGIALIMISAAVAIYFTVGDMTALLGMLAGVIVADAQNQAAAGEQSGLLAPKAASE